MRLRCVKKRIYVILLIIVCYIFLYFLIKHRNSILSPDLLHLQSDFESLQRKTIEPSSFMKDYSYSNNSYCNFKYDLPIRLTYQESDLFYTPQLGQKGTYRVLYNVVKGITSDNNSVTYSTHMTPNFVYYLAEIVRYWETEISVAAFVPDTDAEVIIQHLIQLCHCLPGMEKVSVHFVFPEKNPPIFIPSKYNPDCFERFPDVNTFRNKENLPYPVNVCRNVARKAARTTHVLVSDVELIPSENLAKNFDKMLKNIKLSKIPPYYVFVVPVFEIDVGENIPRTKQELKKLYNEEKAFYFHRWVCQHCQKFPGLVKWLDIKNDENIIKPFTVARRENPFHRWEPIYIGTKNDPFYSETLSWEGQQDKMTQMLEMCLIGYKFVILDGAFLVHWPGIKKRTKQTKIQNEWRRPHQKENTKQYDVIINNLASKYTENHRCKLQ